MLLVFSTWSVAEGVLLEVGLGFVRLLLEKGDFLSNGFDCT
jgi:hypothetical protein